MAIQFGRRRLEIRRQAAYLFIMVIALAAFELFNFSTTEYALGTFFGRHDALGFASWATVLAIAFCSIDFAGLSRLFTPETNWRREPKEVWFLTLAWFLGAAMNAAMTWWAVAAALTENPTLGNELIGRQQVLRYVPVLVALLVWLTRIMLIASISTGGDFLRKQRGAGAPATRLADATGTFPPPATARHVNGGMRRKEIPSGAGSRASSVRSLPRSEPSRHAGMPIGAYDHRATAEELSYVDLD